MWAGDQHDNRGGVKVMSTTLTWNEIILLLALTVIAGFLIGLNRGERGRPAGLRTTLLVCLAASLAMIQANLLLGTVGKAPNSFVVLDLMRLPLGILTGVGFIGAGAIVRRDSIVLGVTTAATLWFITVVGLCLGGGQIILGLVALALGLIALWCLRWAEHLIPQDRRGTLLLNVDAAGPTDADIQTLLFEDQYRIMSSTVAYIDRAQNREASFNVTWRGRLDDNDMPSFLPVLARQQGVLRLEWKPE
jgi:putative Mg2+ transporter-C (MgtC) family protein